MRTSRPTATGPLLDVRNLSISFPGETRRRRVVNGVSFHIESGEALGLVGESGSGKSLTALALLGLVPSPGTIDTGAILWSGRDLLALPCEELRRIRGAEAAMIFQDPMTALNPVLSVGYQIEEALQAHGRRTRREARERACELLEMVGIPSPSSRLADFPHQFSGGQRQRIMIAMALSCDPKLLIADEPTTALDVTIQAQIASLIRELQSRLSMAVLWISHDLALVSGRVERVAVMYAGRIVEVAAVQDLFERPAHPYSRALLRSIPVWDAQPDRLDPIPGTPPESPDSLSGCAFAPRCSFATQACRETEPELVKVRSGHRSACIRWDELDSQKRSQP